MFSVYRLQVSLDKISNEGPVSLINFEDLKMENERLQGELDRTKKVNFLHFEEGGRGLGWVWCVGRPTVYLGVLLCV